MKCGVGTNDVEKCVQNVCKSNVKKFRDIAMIKFIMSRKLLDASIEEKRLRREFGKKSTEFNKLIRKGSEADTRFRIMMRSETEKLWKEGKEKIPRIPRVCDPHPEARYPVTRAILPPQGAYRYDVNL